MTGDRSVLGSVPVFIFYEFGSSQKSESKSSKRQVYGAGAAFFCLEPEPTLNWSQSESALGPRTSGAKAGAAQKSGDSASATLITASNLFLVSILEWKEQSLSLMPIFVCAWIWFVFRLRIRNRFRPFNTIRPLCTGI